MTMRRIILGIYAIAAFHFLLTRLAPQAPRVVLAILLALLLALLVIRHKQQR